MIGSGSVRLGSGSERDWGGLATAPLRLEGDGVEGALGALGTGLRGLRPLGRLLGRDLVHLRLDRRVLLDRLDPIVILLRDELPDLLNVRTLERGNLLFEDRGAGTGLAALRPGARDQLREHRIARLHGLRVRIRE